MQLFARRSTVDEVMFRDPLDVGYGRSDAGVRVNQSTVLSDDAVLACVTLLAGDIANLPMRALTTTDAGLTQPLAKQPTWIEAPDPLDLAITDVAHKTQVAVSLLVASNAYVMCEPSVFDPVTLTVLDPTRVRVIKPARERLFEIMGRSSADAPWEPRDLVDTLSSAQILHIPYLLRPGHLEGTSLVSAQAGNLGISIAMRKWVETFFGKGGQVSGLVSLPVGATGEDVDSVQSRIQGRWSSWRRAGVIGVLGGGAQWIKTGLTPQDADLGSLWRRQLEMAARIYGIPPFMVGSQEPAGVAYASSVERAQHYIDHCVTRYTRPIEKAYSRLVPGDGGLAVPGSNTEVRFVFDAFLRGDPTARWGNYITALQAKARTIGEIRALENLPPMSEYSEEYLAGPDGLYETPQNTSPKDDMPSLIEQVQAGLRTGNEAREVLKLPPMQWSEDLTPEESATLVEQVKAGLRTHDEARALLKLPPMQWDEGLSPEERADLLELVRAGVLTENELREQMKLPPIAYAEGPSPDDIKVLVDQVKEGLLTIDEARANLGRPVVQWPEDLTEKVNEAATLIRAGFDPSDVLNKLGLPSIKHLGLPPITVQKEADATGDAPPFPGTQRNDPVTFTVKGETVIVSEDTAMDRAAATIAADSREQMQTLEVAIADYQLRANDAVLSYVDRQFASIEERRQADAEATRAELERMRAIPTSRKVAQRDEMGRPLMVVETRGDQVIHKLVQRDADGRVVEVVEVPAA